MPASASSLLPPEALARLANLNLIARWVVEGFLQGLHASPYHGFSVEFAEYREYTVGDDLRHLDWKTFGKSDKYYIKKYQSETNLKCHILLDCSASMGYSSGGPTKLRYGACLAAALAHLMTRQQDGVSLVTFDEQIRSHLPARASPRHLREAVKILETVKPSGKTGISGTLHHLAEFVKRRGLIVLISDLYDDPEAVLRGLKHFRHQKHEVIVFHLCDPAELKFPFEQLSDFRDLETGEKLLVHPLAYREAYLAELKGFLDLYRRECSGHLIDYQVVETGTPFETYLGQYLRKRAGLG